MSDLATLDATAQADLVRDGDVSPLELVDAAIERIERLDPELNAVIHPRFERAREEASGPLPDGPFSGVPMVVKDLACETAGDPIHEGMAFLKRLGVVAEEDTELAARFRRAGVVVVGRTNTPELGILPTTEPLAYGPTRNPWDTSRSTGGSSGGSAAAVAAGVVPIGHASDGGGSIRIPASECGLVGLKPARGRVPLAPHFGDVMGGLVCELAVSRTVRDTAMLLDAVHGPATGDPYAAPAVTRPYCEEVGFDPGRLRIGLLSDAPTGADVHADCGAAVTAAGSLLESLGHHVEVSHPKALEDPEYTGHFLTYWSAGAAWSLDYWTRRTGQPIAADDVEPLTWALAEMGRAAAAPAWLSAREWLQHNSREILSWWDSPGFDLLVTPTIAEPPPPLGHFDSPPENPLHGIVVAGGVVPFTPPFNVTGQPAISLPLHQNEAGLPIGVQLVAAAGREDVLLRVSAQLEEASPWVDRRPPVFG